MQFWYRRLATVFLTVAALTYAADPVYSALLTPETGLGGDPLEVSAGLPTAHVLQGTLSHHRANTELNEDDGTDAKRFKHQNHVADASCWIANHTVLSGCCYAKSSFSVEVRSRLASAALYLCSAQEFP